MLERTLDCYLRDELNLSEDSPAFRPVYAATVRYVASGFSSIKDYHDALKAHIDFSELDFTAADFRLEVASMRRFVMNMRFYVLNLCMAKDTKKAVMKYLDYGLTKKEAVLAWNTLLVKPAMRKRIVSVAKQRHKDLDRDIVSVKELRVRGDETGAMFATLAKGATRLAGRKLRWVAMAHNLSIADLASEVMCQTLTIYYQSLPNRFSEEHQLNYLRRGMGSRVDNMNNMYGADKRKRMQKDGNGGYELVIASESQISRGNSEDRDMSYENVMGKDARHSCERQLETTVALDRALSVRKGSKLHALYNTVLGHHTVAFSNFLRKLGLIRDEESSVDWLARRGFKQIVKHLSQWLKVDEIRIQESLQQLRAAF